MIAARQLLNHGCCPLLCLRFGRGCGAAETSRAEADSLGPVAKESCLESAAQEERCCCGGFAAAAAMAEAIAAARAVGRSTGPCLGSARTGIGSARREHQAQRPAKDWVQTLPQRSERRGRETTATIRAASHHSERRWAASKTEADTGDDEDDQWSTVRTDGP